MGKNTSIQWADSSLQLQSGCDGCELWNSKVKICYAGKMIDGDGTGRGFAGKKGWPDSFDNPKLFIERLPEALKWADLTGTAREDKPWLNNYPRIVFLNDMGDTFSKKLPLYWLAPLLSMMAESPHQWLMLTKRPSRAVEFSKRFPFPENFWIGTSVTSEETIPRIKQLTEIQGGSVRFVSFEPLWSAIPAEAFRGFGWAIFGGESGNIPTPCDGRWILDGIAAARKYNLKPFVKQLGSEPIGIGCTVNDSHGGEWDEWPWEYRVREMPAAHLATASQIALL